MSLPLPYYAESGVTIYCGDAREILPSLMADAIITDPVWPHCEHVFPGIDATGLLAEILAVAHANRIVIELGCDSDPRFLSAIPEQWPYLRTCWLEFACPSHKGRILNTGDVAYVFGVPPPPKPGAMILPGKVTATKIDRGFTRGSAENGKASRCGLDSKHLPHPTPRKLQHVLWLTKWFAGDSVIDPLAGSGTTLLAAKTMGIPCIGIEIEERYCEVAVQRLGQAILPLEYPCDSR